MRRDIGAAAEHAGAAARWAERAGDRAALAQALAADALTRCVLGRPWEPTMRRALALEEATAHLRVLAQPSFAYGYCLSCVDEIDRARGVFEELRRRALEQGDEGAMPSVLNHLALLECLAGDWDGAARLADEAHALAVEGGHRPTEASTLAKRAMVAARRGEVDAARDAGERALALAGGPEAALARGGETAIWTLGFLELSLGDPEAADRHLRPLAHALLSAGIRVQGEMRCLPDAIEALAALGRPDEAEPLLEALGTSGRCRGLVLAARGEHEAALAALEQAAASDELPFEHARTLLALGIEQRRARQRRAARTTLEAALGMLRYARRVAVECEGARGARPDRRARPLDRGADARRASRRGAGRRRAHEPRGRRDARPVGPHRRGGAHPGVPQARRALAHRARAGVSLSKVRGFPGFRGGLRSRRVAVCPASSSSATCRPRARPCSPMVRTACGARSCRRTRPRCTCSKQRPPQRSRRRWDAPGSPTTASSTPWSSHHDEVRRPTHRRPRLPCISAGSGVVAVA